MLAAAGPAAGARADSSAPQGHSLDEIREMREVVETKHSQRMREIQDGLTIQSYDADTALMYRMKEDQIYKDRLQQLQAEEQQAYRALDAKQAPRPGGGDNRAPTSPAIPRIQSQSVVTYPPNADPDAPAAEDKPAREGSQKNAGFGTRELEF